ncbi:MAG: rod shape-determining protein MreC [Alphaproteobacteria bacterium]|nr:rod shape-determining protein MreC [Alphaproteobacteria bacterium]
MSSKKVSSRFHNLLKTAAVAVLLPAILIYVIIAKPEYRVVNGISHVIVPVVNGLGDLVTWPVRVGGNLVQKIHKISKLEQENEELRARLDAALANKTDCDVAILENRRLNYEIDTKHTIGYDTVIADVMFDNSAIGHETFLINRGRNDGIERGMVVVSFNNVMVGVVIDAGADFARVRSLTDSNTNIAVRVAGSDVYGFLRGNGSNTPTIGFFSDPKFHGANGVKIVTSNISGILPSNVYVGQMKNESDVLVQSGGELSRVMVLKFNSDEGKYR